jgi:alkylhydroperoxidase/carboxymuconolactone decarboxylase family protein YurZ
VKLVNQWAELKSQQDELTRQQNELQAEIEEIKEALLTIAEREGFERVVGTDKEVSIAQDQKTVFPRKTIEPEAAERMEAALRKSPWWAEVSSLDRNCLVQLWQDPSSLDPKLRNLLKKHVFYEDSVQLRLRNRRD